MVRTTLSKQFRICIPKLLCEALEWKVGDNIEIKFVNIDLIKKILGGEINVDACNIPLIIFNERRIKEDGSKPRRTVFD